MGRYSRYVTNFRTGEIEYVADYSEEGARNLAYMWPNDFLMYIDWEESVEYDFDRRAWYEANKQYIKEELHEYLERWLDHTTAMEESF